MLSKNVQLFLQEQPFYEALHHPQESHVSGIALDFINFPSLSACCDEVSCQGAVK